jgi:hypothetical protein
MVPLSPFPCELLAGDVLHVRSSGPYGWAIRTTLRSWGNHDGLAVYHEDRWYVAEALLRDGYTLTPWSEYEHRVERGKAAVVVLRHPTATPAQRAAICAMARGLAMANPRYDYRAIFWIAYNLVMRTAHVRNRQHQWYCTEANRDLYRAVGLGVWGDDLPTPGTTANRERAGLLQYIGELTPDDWPEYRGT